MEENLTLVSPWVIFYKEIEAMFQRDPEVRVTFDNDNRVIKLLVESGDKAEALSKILEKIVEWTNAAYNIGYENGRRSVTWWESTTPRFSPWIKITCSGTE